MTLKKPIEITEHPIEIHGNICSIAITTDGKYRTVEWVRAKDEKDGYWIESEITIDKINDFKIDHKFLSDAERIHEGITEYFVSVNSTLYHNKPRTKIFKSFFILTSYKFL